MKYTLLFALCAALVPAARAAQLTPEQAAALQAEEQKMKAEAQAAYNNIKGDLRQIQANPQGGLSQQQMQNFQNTSQQAVTNLLNNPQAMQAASANGVNAAQLQKLQQQTGAAFNNLKTSPDPTLGTPAQQLERGLQADGQMIKGDAQQAAAKLEADPRFQQGFAQGSAAAAQAKAKAEQFFQDYKANGGGLSALAKGLGLTAAETAQLKADGDQLKAQIDASPTAQAAKAKVRAALVKFCKKHADDAQVPARCKKVLAASAVTPPADAPTGN